MRRREEFGGGAVADRRRWREAAVPLEEWSGLADDYADPGAGDVAEGFGEGVEGGLFA